MNKSPFDMNYEDFMKLMKESPFKIEYDDFIKCLEKTTEDLKKLNAHMKWARYQGGIPTLNEFENELHIADGWANSHCGW